MHIKYIVERNEAGYIAYPLGIQGIIAGQGTTYYEALEDAKSALRFHVESFGPSVLISEPSVLEAFVEDEVYL